MGHVFFCYARENEKEMKELKSQFTESGITVRTDENIKRNEKDWQQAIETAIDSSFAVVVLLSPSAKNSGWVRSEIKYANNQEKDIFTVLVEGNEKNAVPLILSTAHFTRLVGLNEQKRKEEIISLIMEIKSYN